MSSGTLPQLRLVEFAEARGEQQPLAGKKRFIFDQMRLKTEGILEEPEATTIAGAVLDLEGVLSWAEIGRLPERKASVAEDHVSRCRRPVRYQEPSRLELNQRPLRFCRLPVREEDQKEFVAQVQHLETARCDLEVEAAVLMGLARGESPRERGNELLVRHPVRCDEAPGKVVAQVKILDRQLFGMAE